MAMMDPLGASDVIVDFDRMGTWDQTDVPAYDIMVDDPENMKASPFTWRDDLNKKVVLWSGDLTQLNTEAIVNSTNESITDRAPQSDRIFTKAGAQLKQEVRAHVKNCRTGEAKLTKGYKLPSRYVIHTVGPRYNIKYKTAAESALFNSYRNTLQLVREYKISSLGLPCVHSMRRGYPSYEGAHIAIRAVRRFLENFPDSLEKVIFVVTGDDEEVYMSLLPLYFPRSKSEEDFSAYHLPYDVGNKDGEPVIPERQIRIAGKPTAFPNGNPLRDFDESVNINEAFAMSVAVGAHAFSRMEADVDKQRKQKLEGISTTSVQSNIEEAQKRYDRWLRRSKQEDLSEIERLRCFYQSGFDRYNRPVIVFIGKNFPAQRINVEKAVMHLIQTMDQIASHHYVIVYMHTDTNKENMPSANLIKDIYNIVDYRYKKNLKAFYIVHPTFWSKVYTWFFTTFSLGEMKGKVHHIPGLEYLYQRIPPDQLDLPDFILEHDMRVNGTRYYNPEEDEAIGAL